MNNRHLYKAKRLDNGEWAEGYYAFDYRCSRHMIFINEASCTEGSKPRRQEYSLAGYDIDPSTLCKCTGMTDKKGKLIWENEKCLITRPCTCAGIHIIYKDACFFGYDKLFGTLIKLCDLKANGYEIEVVSDNPELLEAGE